MNDADEVIKQEAKKAILQLVEQMLNVPYYRISVTNSLDDITHKEQGKRLIIETGRC
jgi:hypothetical protein